MVGLAIFSLSVFVLVVLLLRMAYVLFDKLMVQIVLGTQSSTEPNSVVILTAPLEERVADRISEWNDSLLPLVCTVVFTIIMFLHHYYLDKLLDYLI